MNNEYTLDIFFKFKTASEALANLARIEAELISRITREHFEEEYSGLGWKVEINSDVDYDTSTSIMDKLSVINQKTEELKEFINKPLDITKPIKSPWVSEQDLIDLHEQEQKDEDDNYNN